jgi:hypothetical protein
MKDTAAKIYKSYFPDDDDSYVEKFKTLGKNYSDFIIEWN